MSVDRILYNTLKGVVLYLFDSMSVCLGGIMLNVAFTLNLLLETCLPSMKTVRVLPAVNENCLC